ncbi:2-keto-4-pentenoate hydratase [Bordetella genomosp. 1]|uniref:2-keto-4-pentenoate hydratase n=1 Tax=Bordetella genomosp. 1 TaxID=1395607 RepID=UPI0011778ED2|nr:fumarylacetoacetate hydrolase family protein [Bordetella genomosp. 1]
METSASTHQRLVNALVAARRDGHQIEDVTQLERVETEDDAYSVMLQVAKTLGWATAGWKIAATNADLQRRLRTTQPVCGITYLRDVREHPATLCHDELLDPIIECEILFILGKSLPPRTESYSEDEVAMAISSAHIGIEVAQCRFPRKRLPDPLYIQADGFASGHYIRGASIPDWRRSMLNGIGVVLERNGDSIARGSTNDVMGNPLHAITWLSRRLNQLKQGLRAGDLVASGSCNILVPGLAGDAFCARFHGVGEVRVNLTGIQHPAKKAV